VINKTIIYDSAPIFIGAGHNATSHPLEFFEGVIDEIGVYGSVLTQEQITTLYNDKKGLPYLVSEPEKTIEYVCSDGKIVNDVGECKTNTIKTTFKYICSDGTIVSSLYECPKENQTSWSYYLTIILFIISIIYFSKTKYFKKYLRGKQNGK